MFKSKESWIQDEEGTPMTNGFQLRALLLVGLVLATAVPLIGQPSITELLEKNTESLGGSERLRQLRSIRSIGSVEFRGRAGGVRGHYVEAWQRLDRYRREMWIFGRRMLELMNERGAWVIDLGEETPKQMPADDEAELRGSLTVNGPLLDYSRRGYKLVYVGEDTLGYLAPGPLADLSPSPMGDSLPTRPKKEKSVPFPAPKIEVPVFHYRAQAGDAVAADIFVDQEHLLELKVVSYGGPPTTPVSEWRPGSYRKTFIFGKYKTVDGITMPWYVGATLRTAGGDKELSFRVSRVELNLQLPEDSFDLPAK